MLAKINRWVLHSPIYALTFLVFEGFKGHSLPIKEVLGAIRFQSELITLSSNQRLLRMVAQEEARA